MNFYPNMQFARFADLTPDIHGKISKRTAELHGVSATEVTFHAGARWSVDLAGYAGTELCELPHVALVTQGTLGVRMADGSERVFTAGDAMLLPPGHDAWSVGDRDCVFVEFSQGNDYYAA